MPNLLVASGIFHPETGGPATYLRQILPALMDSGWQIRVLSYGDSQIHEYPYPVSRVPRQVYPLRLARYGWRSRALLRWADVTYLHTIDLPLWGDGGARVIKIVGDQAWERCVRKGWIPPGMSIDAFQTGDVGWLARWQRESRSRQARRMAAVITPSAYLRRMVLGWGVAEARAHLIYNALPDMPRPSHSRTQLRQMLGWDDRPTLLTAARLQPWKGIDHLIVAMRQRAELRLVIAGAGPDEARLRGLAASLGDRVVFTGVVPQPELRQMMSAADGFALYSGYEGLSHSLLESLQLGTPVLASDRGGNPEIARDGVNGVLVAWNDRDALLDGIDRLLESRESLAANARIGLEAFSFQEMARATDELLRSLAP